MRASSSSMPVLTLRDGKGAPVLPDSDGVFAVWDQSRYLLSLEPPADPTHREQLEALPRSIYEPLQPGMGLLNFKNQVGYLHLLGAVFHVQSKKLLGDPSAVMIRDLSRSLAALPFSFNAPTFIPYELSEDRETSILYHRWLLLSAWVEGTGADESLEGALGKVLHDPHRRMSLEPEAMPVSRANRFSADSLLDMVTNPAALASLPPESSLAQTALARRIHSHSGRSLFPETIRSHRAIADLDTPENRFVKYVLRVATALNRRFRDEVASRPTCLNADLLGRCEAIDAILSECLSRPFFDDVGELRMLPSQSMVLQRRDGYRDFLLGYARLDSNLRFPVSDHDLKAILEAKDIAKLYEYWCFFRVADALTELLHGPPDEALVIEPDAFQASVSRETRLKWRVNGSPLTLSYDRTFSGGKKGESYSVRLRPDITLEWQGRRHLFDAKFKLDGIRWEDDLPDVSGAGTTREDLYKMHTYRDAIAGVASAIVLYPGEAGVNASLLFEHEGATSVGFHGIGAIALRPGDGSSNQGLADFLAKLVRSFAGWHAPVAGADHPTLLRSSTSTELASFTHAGRPASQ